LWTNTEAFSWAEVFVQQASELSLKLEGPVCFDTNPEFIGRTWLYILSWYQRGW